MIEKIRRKILGIDKRIELARTKSKRLRNNSIDIYKLKIINKKLLEEQDERKKEKLFQERQRIILCRQPIKKINLL